MQDVYEELSMLVTCISFEQKRDGYSKVELKRERVENKTFNKKIVFYDSIIKNICHD